MRQAHPRPVTLATALSQERTLDISLSTSRHYQHAILRSSRRREDERKKLSTPKAIRLLISESVDMARNLLMQLQMKCLKMSVLRQSPRQRREDARRKSPILLRKQSMPTKTLSLNPMPRFQERINTETAVQH